MSASERKVVGRIAALQAAANKEMYDDDRDLQGWAVMDKTEEDSGG